MNKRTDFSHLDALQDSLIREQARLVSAKSPSEIALRTVWVSQIEKEIAAEYKFLGIEPMTMNEIPSDDDLLAELMA